MIRSRFSSRSKRVAATAVFVVALTTVASGTFAGEGDEGSDDLSVPGIPYSDEAAGGSQTEGLPASEAIIIGGTTFDPTVVTKFIPASGFTATQGDAAEADLVRPEGADRICLRPDTNSGGTFTQLRASVELPDGSRIKRIVAYGADTDVANNMIIQLHRADIVVPLILGSPTRSESTVTSFNTSGVTGTFALASTDNLAEIAGSFSGSPVLNTTHRFHQVYVSMSNAALASQVLCGVEVQYQVPTVSADAGSVFHPIAPVRAFDSRLAAYTGSGLLAPNTSKVVSIKDSHDANGAVNATDVVPAGATAIAYNITIAGPTGPNYLAVTAGDAASFTASAINFNGTSDLANAAIVTIAADRTIKIWGGDQAGSTHVIIDVTGSYGPITNPNMAN